MKRYIHNRYELRPIHENSIYCGVSVQGKRINFDFDADSDKDIITLVNDSSGEYDDDNVMYVYGYTYTPNARKTDVEIFRNFIKGKTTSRVWYNEDVEEFIKYGVLAIERYADFSDFGAIVTLGKRNEVSTVGMIRQQLMYYIQQGTIQFHLIKQAYENVQFDRDLARIAMRKTKRYSDAQIEDELDFTEHKFNQLKQNGGFFAIKKFLPPVLRAGFLNYFKFETEEERKVFEQLQGVNVLIYDDFMTSGSTIKEVIRYLRAINDRNTLTVFVLVKQH